MLRGMLNKQGRLVPHSNPGPRNEHAGRGPPGSHGEGFMSKKTQCARTLGEDVAGEHEVGNQEHGFGRERGYAKCARVSARLARM